MSPEKINDGYNQYLIFRKYDPSSSKLIILKRALIDSWGEPGFHRFWQVWNPGIGHLLYRFYRLLGGNRNRLIATMLVFMLCGILHDMMVMLIFRRPFVAFTTAFILFGILALINRAIEPILDQEKWPKWLNTISNVSCLAVSIFLAVQVQVKIFP
jgi:hypothetical protein